MPLKVPVPLPPWVVLIGVFDCVTVPVAGAAAEPRVRTMTTRTTPDPDETLPTEEPLSNTGNGGVGGEGGVGTRAGERRSWRAGMNWTGRTIGSELRYVAIETAANVCG